MQFLLDLPDVSKEALKSLPALCVLFHQSVSELSARFLTKERRHYYVTPTSYLELLLSYKDMLRERQNDVSTVRKRYIVGLEKLGKIGRASCRERVLLMV